MNKIPSGNYFAAVIMKVFIAVCLSILGIAFWKGGFRSSVQPPVPLFPDPNAAFFELRPLTPLEREMIDFRPDCLHTPLNFSHYNTVPFPQRDCLRETIEERLEASVQRLGVTPITLPNAQPPPYVATVPIFKRTVRPLPNALKKVQKGETKTYRKIGSTGLPFDAEL